MKTPGQIDFKHCDNADGFRKRIEENIAGLEDRFGRITACRIFLRRPGEHQRHKNAGTQLLRVKETQHERPTGNPTARYDQSTFTARNTTLEFAQRDTTSRVAGSDTGNPRCG